MKAPCKAASRRFFASRSEKSDLCRILTLLLLSNTMPLETTKVSQEHYAAVGRVASNWAILELVVDAGCWRLGKFEYRLAACITAQITGMARKWDAFMALAEQRGYSDRKHLNKIAEMLRAASEKRNRIVHDSWAFDSENNQIVRLEISARKSLVYERQPVTTKEIEAFGDELYQKATDLESAIRTIIESVPT